MSISDRHRLHFQWFGLICTLPTVPPRSLDDSNMGHAKLIPNALQRADSAPILDFNRLPVDWALFRRCCGRLIHAVTVPALSQWVKAHRGMKKPAQWRVWCGSIPIERPSRQQCPDRSCYACAICLRLAAACSARCRSDSPILACNQQCAAPQRQWA